MYKAAITVGVFDMLHEGHINLLNTMRLEAETIYVIVHDDHSTFLNKGKFPVQELGHRVRNLERARVATEVVSCTNPDPSPVLEKAVVAMQSMGPVLYMRGDDWVEFPGKDVLAEHNITIKYIPYTKGVSSSQRRDEL